MSPGPSTLEAWRDPGAYIGATMAGPVELPADQAAGRDPAWVRAWTGVSAQDTLADRVP